MSVIINKGSDTSANKLIQKTLIIIDSNGKIASNNKYHVKSKMQSILVNLFQ